MRIIKKGNTKSTSIFEIFKFKEFIFALFLRNIATMYKQTVLGPFWQILNPLIQSLMFTLVFSKIAKLPTDEIPPFLFYSSAMLIWVFFQSTSMKTSDCFLNFSQLIRNAYIPKITIALSLLLENIFLFVINFFIFVLLYLYFIFLDFEINFNFKLLIFLPIVVLYVSILSGSIGLIVACLSAKFRDLRFIISYGLQIAFYGTPIVYSLNSIPDKYHIFFYFNPMTFFIDYFRNLFFSTGELNLNFLYSSIIFCLLVSYIAKKLYFSIVDNLVDYV